MFKSLFMAVALIFSLSAGDAGFAAQKGKVDKGAKKAEVQEIEESSDVAIYESDASSTSIFSRAWQGGPIVFMVLMLLISASVLTWSILVTKWLYLRKIEDSSEEFVKQFWDSKSLNDLNSKLSDYAYSPVKEVFRTCYMELVKGSQLREQSGSSPVVINAAMQNMSRALHKSKTQERKKMEKYLAILAITSSGAPFIGLFGTVWGIMGAFEGIARTGSASLAAVAPGISEALIATAFGLAAAIPALIGYNLSVNKIKSQMTTLESFGSDFLNIVERYLVTERPAKSGNTQNSPGI